MVKEALTDKALHELQRLFCIFQKLSDTLRLIINSEIEYLGGELHSEIKHEYFDGST